MDSAYIKQLERLFMKASPYMGTTWRKGVSDSLAAIYVEFYNLSTLCSDHLETAVNAESTIKSLREEIELLTEHKNNVNAVTDTEVEIKETVISIPEPIVITETEVSIEASTPGV